MFQYPLQYPPILLWCVLRLLCTPHCPSLCRNQVRIRTAAINARDIIVIAYDPIYLSPTIPDLTPCADGVGEITVVGEGSKWKVGDRAMIFPFDSQIMSARNYEEDLADAVGSVGQGAGSVQ